MKMLGRSGMSATGVGALPHTDPREACDAVIRVFPDFPYVPTLPARGTLEGSYSLILSTCPGGSLTASGSWSRTGETSRPPWSRST